MLNFYKKTATQFTCDGFIGVVDLNSSGYGTISLNSGIGSDTNIVSKLNINSDGFTYTNSQSSMGAISVNFDKNGAYIEGSEKISTEPDTHHSLDESFLLNKRLLPEVSMVSGEVKSDLLKQIGVAMARPNSKVKKIRSKHVKWF